MEKNKMTKPLITEHNVVTDEMITREMTDSEFEVYLLDKAENDKIQIERENQVATKQTLLTRLGITEEEAKLLLS
jgi:hypothetical protein